MKHAFTRNLICVERQHGKRLVQKQQEWYALEEKKFNMLLATTKRLLGNFCFFEEAAKKDCTF